ncbi:MAG: hypothetical protein KBA46_06990, partial [Candidatus Omnitrophica bacterium]|nr:hypothetical protein [Candidatus Omnitrophota bacterium]
MQEAVCQQKVIKALVFDLGRVLIDFDHMIAARKIARSPGVPAEQIYQFFFDSPLTGLFEEGAISAHDFFHEVKVQLDLNLEFEEFIAIWNDIFFLSDSNRAVYQLVVSLRDRYTL